MAQSGASVLFLGLLFVLGGVHDAFCALYLRAVHAHLRGVAAMISGLLTAFGFASWWLIIHLSGSTELSLIGVLLYAAGGACGTYVGFKGHVPVCPTENTPPPPAVPCPSGPPTAPP